MVKIVGINNDKAMENKANLKALQKKLSDQEKATEL